MTTIAQEIIARAEAARLDPVLVRAVVMTESSGRPCAYRYEPRFWDRYLADNPLWKDQEPRRVSASYGLMQVMYPVAWELGFREEPELLTVPRVGLFWGCTLLAGLLQWSKGDVDQALAAFNGGKGAGLQAPHYPNADYIRKVRGFLEV